MKSENVTTEQQVTTSECRNHKRGTATMCVCWI